MKYTSTRISETYGIARPGSRTTRNPSSFNALGHAQPEFPAVFRRTDRLDFGDVDTGYRSGLSRLSADEIRTVVGHRRLRDWSARDPDGTDWRRRHRPLPSTRCPGLHPVFADDPRLYPGVADLRRDGSGLAYCRAGILAWHDQYARRSGASTDRRRNGWARRPLQRHRLELDHEQRRSHPRTRRRWGGAGAVRSRLVFLLERGVVPSGDHQPPHHESPLRHLFDPQSSADPPAS